jgi:hypothetical protein
MPNSRLLSLLVFGVAFGLGVASCSQGTQEGESGSLSLQLTIVDDVEIDEVAWVISRVGMEPMGGTIDTSAPGATASIEVFGLLPSVGKDYTITMEAIATDGETTCKGSEDFGIDVGEVTEIMVMLNCKRPQRLGAVRVNGKFNICAELTKVVVSPLQTSVGNDIDLASQAVDLEGDAIDYQWSGTGGTIDDPGAASTTYTCTEAGNHFVTIQVSDDDFEYCMSGWTVAVTCVDGDGGTGGTAGTGGTGGTGGMGGGVVCDEGDCATDTEKKAKCETFVIACIANEAPEEECLLAGLFAFCAEGGGGTGGSGGAGGGGGTGGAPNPSELCNEDLCAADDDLKQLCEDAIAACIANNLEIQWEECILGITGIVCRAQ